MSIQQGLDYVTTAFAAGWSWFAKLMAALPGAFGLIVSGFFLFLVVRLLLAPLVGAAVRANASDTVKQIRNAHKDTESAKKE